MVIQVLTLGGDFDQIRCSYSLLCPFTVARVVLKAFIDGEKKYSPPLGTTCGGSILACVDQVSEVILTNLLMPDKANGRFGS